MRPLGVPFRRRRVSGAEAGVQHAVRGAELERAADRAQAGVRDAQQHDLGERVGEVRRRVVGHEARHHGVARDVVVEHVEVSALRVVGGEGEAPEALVDLGADPRRDVEEGALHRAGHRVDDADAPALLDHEETRVAPRGRHEDGPVEAHGDGHGHVPGRQVAAGREQGEREEQEGGGAAQAAEGARAGHGVPFRREAGVLQRPTLSIGDDRHPSA